MATPRAISFNAAGKEMVGAGNLFIAHRQSISGAVAREIRGLLAQQRQFRAAGDQRQRLPCEGAAPRDALDGRDEERVVAAVVRGGRFEARWTFGGERDELFDDAGVASGVNNAVARVAGLVAITPASGYVGPMSSIIIGAVAGGFLTYFLARRSMLIGVLAGLAAAGIGDLSDASVAARSLVGVPTRSVVGAITGGILIVAGLPWLAARIARRLRRTFDCR